MRLTFRILVSTLLTATLVTVAFTLLQVHRDRVHLADELRARAGLVADNLETAVDPYWTPPKLERMYALVARIDRHAKFLAIGVFNKRAQLLVASGPLRASIHSLEPLVADTLERHKSQSSFERIGRIRTFLYAQPMAVGGTIVVVQDVTPLHLQNLDTWKHNLAWLAVMLGILSFAMSLQMHLGIHTPLKQIAEWVKTLRAGTAANATPPPQTGILGPLADEVTQLAQSFYVARSAAEQEARLRVSGASLWTPERLKQYILQTLGGRPLFLVSNREPYVHSTDGDKIRYSIPPGGVVTALDPVMRACGGTWIAHGSGNADRQVADAQGHMQVPPDDPAYTLRRVWLTKEEEEGYYYGFCNEGLWPLCHIVHTRPTFRLEDWIQFQKANERFAEAVLEEIEGETAPLVLVQDFHLALLPALIKRKRPDAKVGLFWHVPWPNSEAFGICPWRNDILLGMLGADLIGFHTQYHCNNFLDTVDATLECKIKWEQFAIQRGGRKTYVKPFPIGVAFPESEVPGRPQILEDAQSKKELLQSIGIEAEFLAVGVDRIDYTKGLLERFRAIERFLDKYPNYVGRLTFVELGAPSRTLIKRYGDLIEELTREEARINARFERRNWKPIVFWKDQHRHDRIEKYYREADVCLVTSLHDGMNLVAKEFVAAKESATGVLILSPFTGAARELQDALIINPYDIEALADGIHRALTMSPYEQNLRMSHLRAVIKENNVYRWAANLIAALGQLSRRTEVISPTQSVTWDQPERRMIAR